MFRDAWKHAAAGRQAWARELPWPLPALMGWAAAWLVLRTGAVTGLSVEALWLGAIGAVLAAMATCRGLRRKLIIAAGFGTSIVATEGISAFPAWGWLLLLLPLLAAYPVRAWHDAPIFPTPSTALQGLATMLAPPHRVLDAGCGLGHGLQALHALWPDATLHGVEWSWPLAIVARWRCRTARIERGDMWRRSWADFDLVYLFQRPESMSRAYAKARAEMQAGAWLVSLEFAVPGAEAHACLQGIGGRPVWVYRMAPKLPPATAQSTTQPADNPLGSRPACDPRPAGLLPRPAARRRRAGRMV